jgi:hypothetical protein
MYPLVALIRRWAVEWVSAADAGVCGEILSPTYNITIGGHRIDGLDTYVETALGQLQERFPGVGITVHELICDGERGSVRFTLHGADARGEWRRAAWRGIALFSWDGSQLTHCFAEEDFFARRRQLSSGCCDPIEPPDPAPWNTEPARSDSEAEQLVREWLEHGELKGVALDDGAHGAYLRDTRVEIHELFSAGQSVAFHARQSGNYAGGLDGVEAEPGTPGAHDLAGLVHVRGEGVAGGSVVRDRLGLARRLTKDPNKRR